MSEIVTTVKNKQLVQKRREQIVQAAIKLFSQKGIYKTTLKDLAKQAGLSYGNIYQYVSQKDDIFWMTSHPIRNNVWNRVKGVGSPGIFCEVGTVVI